MTTAKTFEIRGVHVLMGMLAFFGIVIAVNVVFAVEAIRSFPGEDVRRSYLQGLNYNSTLAERRAQAAMGWQARASIVETENGPAVRVLLRDAAGQPIDRAALDGELRWRADARRDRPLTFQSVGAGAYVAPLESLPEGRWVMRAQARNPQGEGLDFEAELTWPSSL